ncbi:MAG TPA: hypothetical protein VGN11_08400, partial [Candidatus Baltobacteraceae bacterium]|nr:hypothetical protein [Candidatus Baltobacteraceae bacterium]
MELLAGEDDAAVLPQVVAHYELVAPLLEKQFGGSPITYANFPGGFSQPPYYHITGAPLSARKLLWCVHRFYAIEFHSWAPQKGDETRLRFARVLLERPAAVSDAGAPPFRDDRMKEAALALRVTLVESHIEAIPLLDGRGGIALWIPLADAPAADTVRAWLHATAACAVARHPALLSAEPNTRDLQRVHIHVSSNARHRYSAMPYSLRGAEDLPVCTPIAWEELGEIPLVAATARTFAQRLNRCGDVFANQLALIAPQALPASTPGGVLAVSSGHTPEPRGRIITAAIAILDDGIARSADDLCAEAIKRGLIPKTTLRKYVYSALIEYIARSMGRGRRPPIVQDE